MPALLSWLLNLTGQSGAADGGSRRPQRQPPGEPLPTPFSYSPHFEKPLRELNQRLRPGKWVVLTGMPGVGKSYLAREYANQVIGKSTLVWVSAGIISDPADEEQYPGNGRTSNGRHSTAPAPMLDEFRRRFAISALDYLVATPGAPVPARLGRNRDLAEVQDRIITAFSGALERRDDWLLVLDSLDGYFCHSDCFKSVRSWVPASHGGRVLITSIDDPAIVRGHGLDHLELGPLGQEEGARLLLEWAGLDEDEPAEWEDAKRIAHLLGGLPLAVDQAAAYVRRRREETRGNYTLSMYLDEYRPVKSPTRRQRPGGSHASVFRTFQIPFGRLVGGKAEEKLAADYLRLSAFFHPEDIPRGLLESHHPDGQAPVAGEVEEAIQIADRLRLLRHDPRNQAISLHRLVRDVMRDLLADDEAAWRQRAMACLDRALADDSAIGRLFPHVQALASEGPVPEELRLLRECIADLDLLKDLRSGDSWEKLLWEGHSPTYEEMHWLEDDRERARVRRRMAAIRQVCGDRKARIVFVCVYFVVHYWWDLYLDEDRLAEPLLDLWEQTADSEADRKLVATLRKFQKEYPPVRQYRQRVESTPSMVDRWNRVGQAIQRVREQIGIEPPDAATATSAERYARGITNIYLAEALRYGRGLEQYAHPGSEHALRLTEEAEQLFEQNADGFHGIWARYETASLHVEAARRSQQLAGEGDRDRGKLADEALRHLTLARGKCEEGLNRAVTRAEEDDIDAEVIAGFYSTLAELEWVAAREPGAVLPYRCAASFVAYAFVLSEEDVYSISFYEEHVERTMDWLRELAALGPEQAVRPGQFLRRFWHREELDSETLLRLFSRRSQKGVLRLRSLLFPSTPAWTGTSHNAELTEASRRAIVRLVRAMPQRASALQQYPLPETFVSVARVLKAQLA